ncbi:uncharacterized protein LOC126456132 [Schistocerca serialis cubense]|uniref:uncharacterized protein LOC126456132 n=1 Tax=Schistocerca serialis cubense TaxID=2023355 RepID=UPI00214F2140|nr:uncharacterized protein LOC126456132 [Schistocerca serialis cubense]
MGRDSDCQPPEWLNREFIAVALKPEYSGKSPRVASMTVEDANKTQRGYTSRLYRVTAKVEVAAEAEVHAWHLIVKCSIETGIVSEVSRLQQLFPRETLMLTSLVPAVHEALRRLRAEAVAPRCLLAASSPVDVLVMEDLSAAGYGPPPAGFLDLEHCRLVLDRLAQWHAASCTLDLARPDSGADPLLRRDPFWQPPVASLLQPYHRKQFRSIGVALGNFPDCYKYSKKYKTDSEEWVDKIVHAVTRSCAQSDFKVLVHADVWNKNIMVKYRDGKPVDLRFVDFQVSHLASPARDLVFFLYGNASEQVHRRHLSDLLLEYHCALSAALRDLGLQRQADAYPLHKLLADMDSLAMLALYCVCYAPLSTATDQRGVAIMDGLGVTGDYSEALVKLYSDPTLISFWRFINPILESKGAL